MRLRFADDDLRRLFEDAALRMPQLGTDVVKAYRKKVAFLAAADDERDLRNHKALHYEKLEGDRAGTRSIRLNDQWRLLLRVEMNEDGPAIVVTRIADYH